MYIERDSRRQTPRDKKTEGGTEAGEYMGQCLEFLINYVVEILPAVFSKYSFVTNLFILL